MRITTTNNNNNNKTNKNNRSQSHHVPLGSFTWANGTEVWNCMVEKDTNYSKLRSEKMLLRHPSLVDSYRTILFDWLSEVAHECRFHRETYHLAIDFTDRYLTAQANVGKLQLQLIGVTCLFLASKFEEIRPPTVVEFAELTDGACKPEDIIDQEVVILSAINWDITPMTPNNWLNIYMQILHVNINDSFILPATNGIFRSNHKRIASVIDLALLHIGSLRFSNSILTASALYHFTDQDTVRQCTGFTHDQLVECLNWLKPFVETIKDIREPVFVASCRNELNSTQMHTHVATAKLLEKVIAKMDVQSNDSHTMKRKACCMLDDDTVTDSDNESIHRLSPSKPTTLLTPPRSARKSRRVQ